MKLPIRVNLTQEIDMKKRCFSMLFLLGVLAAGAQFVSAQQSATLYALKITESKTIEDSKSYLSFEYGVRGSVEPTMGGRQWDLGYGLLAINDEDWFAVSHGDEDRSVIKDLGELDWTDSVVIPVLKPLPALEKGQSRDITVDASADTGKAWAETTTIFAKVFVGHMYVVHIKRDEHDFYALFRVESIAQRDNCTITWAMISSPEQFKF
jgi:hypothetical protein